LFFGRNNCAEKGWRRNIKAPIAEGSGEEAGKGEREAEREGRRTGIRRKAAV